MFANGPPVKLVGVAKRLKAVTGSFEDLLVAWQNRNTQPKERSMAHFLPCRYKLEGLYECRGISIMRTSIGSRYKS